MKKLVSGVLASLIVASSFIINPTAAGDTNAAVAYLKTVQLNPWVAMALASAGENPDVSSLKSVSGSLATDYAAVILALTANNKDPRTYPDEDFVAKLKTYHTGGQIGDASIQNDDIFAILALRSAGLSVTDPAVADAKAFVLSHQNSDGGWSFASSGTSDTNTTAAAIMALVSAGVDKSHEQIVKAVTYLKAAQNSDGGFPYDPVSPWGTDSDSASTAWIISAINLLGDPLSAWTKNGKTPTDFLLSLQDASGYFKYQTGSSADSFTPVTTSYAVVSLSGKHYPVASVALPSYPSVSYRIAGRDSDLCEGEIYAPNALELVKIAAQTCGFTYNIQATSFGPYLDRIGDDTAAGTAGWLYNVNYLEPSVGANDYDLTEGDFVLWHFNDFTWKLTRLSLSSSEASSGASVTATVEWFDGSVWSALEGASVRLGNSVTSTNSEGKATLSAPDGSYKVFAIKDGYVRTESETLIFGTKSEQQLNLSATIQGGGSSENSPNNSSISFTIGGSDNGSTLGFGEIAKGSTYTKNISLSNTGQVKIYVEANVTGDDVFRNYLNLDNALWRSYDDQILAGESRPVSVGLTVPESYNGSGSKNGKLIFWAIQGN